MKKETKNELVLRKIKELSKVYELDGVVMCLTRKSDGAIASITYAEDIGITLRLMHELRIKQRKLDLEVEMLVRKDLFGSFEEQLPEITELKGVRKYIG